ncbi:MAG TPA: GNAT family N-acetyltransferase [Terriglobales bacterium]|nr:GNAT family N-acetyltransferase [Terriglobales bacterium]
MLSIRPATIEDVPLLRAMICELAEYERELESVKITDAQLARDGFGEDPKFRALIAEWNGQPAGYAVFFQFYSTWTGRHMFLEDLFVRPQLRGKKIGMTLMAKVASIAREEGCNAMRWEVLAWNQPSIDLYQSLGGEFLDDWKLVLLRDEALKRLAERAA